MSRLELRAPNLLSAILAALIPSTFKNKTKIVSSTIATLVFITIYRILKSFKLESFEDFLHTGEEKKQF